MKHIIITISREYGCGAREIGQMLSEKLGIPCYDKSIIDKTAEVSAMSPDFVEKNEQHLTNSLLYDMSTTANVYRAQTSVIRDYATEGSCIIIGRCADKILENDYNCLKVFLYADFVKRCKRAVEKYGVDAKGVESVVKKTDRNRERFFRIFHDGEWREATNYNLCLNTGLFGTERTAEIIEAAYKIMQEA